MEEQRTHTAGSFQISYAEHIAPLAQPVFVEVWRAWMVYLSDCTYKILESKIQFLIV